MFYKIDHWSSGCGMKLIENRLRVQIPAQDGKQLGGYFSHWLGAKNWTDKKTEMW